LHSQKLEEAQRKKNEADAIRDSLTQQLEVLDKNLKKFQNFTASRLSSWRQSQDFQRKMPGTS
jgi:hypothetical protein